MAAEDPEPLRSRSRSQSPVQSPVRSPTRSPAVSSTWYDSSASCRSLETSSTSTASDPYCRDPVERLKRWKLRVAHGMKLLRDYGQEGKDVIQRQELRARGYLTNIFMRDGRTRPPDDLNFWKARHDFFAKEWRLLQARNYNPGPAQPRVLNPHLEWIRDWIANTQAATAGVVDRPNNSEDAAGETHSSEPQTAPSLSSRIATTPPNAATLGDQSRVANKQARDEAKREHAASETHRSEPASVTVARRQTRGTAKRAHDEANGPNNGGASPAKRSKRDALSRTEKNHQVAQPKQNAGKAIISAPTVAQVRPRRAPQDGRGKAGVQKAPAPAPPRPRRHGARSAALDVAKAGHDQTKSVGRRTSTTASRAAAAAAAAAKASDEKAKLVRRRASTTTRPAATTEARAEKAKPVSRQTHAIGSPAAAAKSRHAHKATPVSRPTSTTAGRAATAKAKS